MDLFVRTQVRILPEYRYKSVRGPWTPQRLQRYGYQLCPDTSEKGERISQNGKNMDYIMSVREPRKAQRKMD